MQTENLVAVDIFCTNHNIDISFISSLQENGMIDITTIEETEFIAAVQLKQLEKMIRFYYELDINLEGIDAIIHLLNRINALQDENAALKNKLRFYEANN